MMAYGDAAGLCRGRKPDGLGPADRHLVWPAPLGRRDARSWHAGGDMAYLARRMEFVSNEAIVAAARAGGRVMTTAQDTRAAAGGRRRHEAVGSRQDRFLPCANRLAVELLAEILRDDPESAEALLLQGYLYDLWSIDQPDEA